MPLVCRLGHRRTFTLKGFIYLWQPTTLVSRQGQRFIPRDTPYAFLLTNSRHSLLSSAILFACLTSKPLFLKYTFTISIHLLCNLPTEQVRLSWQSYPSPSSPHGRTTRAHLHQSFHVNPSSLRTSPLSVHSGTYLSS